MDIKKFLNKIEWKDFFKLSRFEKEDYIGVDISDSAVKVLSLASAGHSYQVKGCAIVPLPMNAIIDNVINDLEAVGRTILDAKRKAGITATKAVIALPTPLVMSGVIPCNVDFTEKDIEAKIWNEAAHIMPYSLEEISLDFHVLGASAEDELMVDVLYVAARSDEVARRVELLRLAELEAKVVDVDSYAIARTVKWVSGKIPDAGKGKVIAVVDIGATATSLTVLKDFNVIFSLEERFGGRQLTLQIQEKYNLPFAEAGRIKKEGYPAETHETDVLGIFRDTLVAHVKRTLQFFFSTGTISSIDYLLLAGGTVSTPGLTTVLQKEINAPVILVNPFEEMNFETEEDKDFAYKNATSLMLTLGIALWGGME